MLREDIIDLSRSVKQLGMDLIIVTNGVLLPYKKEILDYADVLNISVDGNEETHDKLRGKGNYEKVIKAAEVLRDAEKRNLKKVINTILNNERFQILC